jgi:protein CpxP
MRASRNTWVMVLSLALVCAFGFVLPQALGQSDSATQEKSAMGSGQHAANVESRLQKMSEELNLTDDQKAKLKPILQDQAEQMKAVHNDTSLTPEQKKAKMKEIHHTFQPQIAGVLTPEQQAKWKQMKQEAMEKHHEMKGQMEQH